MAMPDELTPEQMAEMKAGSPPPDPVAEAPDELTPEQVAQYKEVPVQAASEVPVADTMPEELSVDEMSKLKLDAALSGHHSDALEKDLGTGAVSAVGAANVIPAAKEFYSKENGWLENSFYALTIPEQFVARQAVNVIENMGGMSSDEARDLLARDQVHGSDIVNFYWRDPQTWYGKTGRFVTGLAADILIDPLSYIGIGALTQAAKEATIAGKTLSGLGKMSKAERGYYKTLETIEKVIKADTGMVVKGTESVEDAAKLNQMAIAKARDLDLAAPRAMQMGIDDLVKELKVSSEVKNTVLEQSRVGLTEKTWAKEWQEGSRGLTFGARIPFTDAAFEVDLPGHISKLASLPVVALDASFGLVRSGLRATPWGDAAYNLLSDISTRTGKFLFDVQQNTRLGSGTQLREELGEFKKRSRVLMVQKQKNLGTERFANYLADVVDEMEMGLKGQDEAEALAAKFGATGQDLTFLTQGTSADAARAARLADHPETLDLIDDMREMMSKAAKQYQSRGLPFEELNPFGEGWARNYLKHEYTDQFLAKLKEVGDASDSVGEAMKTMPQLMGKVDTSALGRKYRGTIRDANKASLEQYGIKALVDDPIELISNRMEEMHKVLQDHDLMEAALPYVVKGKDPGVGYVKFNVDDFKRLSIDKSDEFAAKWDAFIPQDFKTGQSMYVPEDVYDRMLFNINGWDLSKPMTKFLGAADVYMNVWRNNALFGPSYLGLNAFSNMLTYASFNNIGGPGAIAKATGILTPFAKGIKVMTPHMGELTGEAVLAMAHEKNLLSSSFARGLEFSHMAEHVASNRQARQTIGQKAMNVADYAFLWRLNRATAQFADEIPKLATFISRLEKGFSVNGAAELAERYYYNFNNMSRVQSGVAKVIPFSSFPMKTAELVYEQARTGHLAALTIPGKVQAALDGAFVQDHEARQALDQMLPGYKNVLHPIHGEIMPGMRELQVDIPWAYSTMNSLFHPEDAVHPIAQIMMLAGSFNSNDEEQQAEDAHMHRQFMASQVDLLIPPYMREALTLAEISGGLDMGGFFKSRYLATMPTRTQIERAASDRGTLDKGTAVQKFTNAVEFGRAMDEKYGDNWLYNFALRGRVDRDDDSLVADQEAATRGEYIRRRFRQFSLGLASMNKLDSTFFMNTFAIKRQIDIKQRELKNRIIQSGALVDTERINDEEFQKQWAEEIPAAKELLALSYKRDALEEYYDFFLGAEKKIPDLDLPSIIFGTNEFEFDFGDKPDKEVYEKLFKRQTMENIPEEDATDLIEGIGDKEAP